MRSGPGVGGVIVPTRGRLGLEPPAGSRPWRLSPSRRPRPRPGKGVSAATGEEDIGALSAFRQLASLDREVLVLSGAMFALSLGFQMTSRYLPEYLAVLGASPFVVGLYGTVGNVLGVAWFLAFGEELEAYA